MRRFLIIFAGVGAVFLSVAVGALIWFGRAYPPAEVVEYARFGDEALQLYVFEPEIVGDSRLRPAALLFHGGGWRHGLPEQMFHTAKLLAAHGYVAFSVGYRLQGSHGATPFDCVDDAKNAYRWVWDHADRWRIDRGRIVVGGSSAGGHLAAAVALIPRTDDPPQSPAAMLLINAAVDTSFEKPMNAAMRRFEGDFAGRGREISPTHHIRAGAPPAIVFHGVDDGMVPFEHARQFCDRMRAVASVCELVAYPDARHGFYNLGMDLVDDVDAKLLAFLDRLQITGSAVLRDRGSGRAAVQPPEKLTRRFALPGDPIAEAWGGH